VGLYRPVHVKTLRSQKLRMLLTHRNGFRRDRRAKAVFVLPGSAGELKVPRNLPSTAPEDPMERIAHISPN